MAKKHSEKMYLVKREVMAKNIREAMNKSGKIYEIQIAAIEYQPEEKKEVGFDKK